MTVLSWSYCLLVVKMGCGLGQFGLNIFTLIVVELAMFDRDGVMVMLFWKHLLIFNRLDRCVVMVLMHLFIHNCGNFLMS